MSDNSEEVRFYQNLQQIIAIVGTVVYNNNIKEEDRLNPILYQTAVEFINNMDRKQLLEMFIKNSLPYWDIVHEKDEKFFLDHGDKLFNNLPINVNIFRKLYVGKTIQGEEILNVEIKEKMWFYIHNMVKIGLKYVHLNRQPQKQGEDYEYQNPSFFPQVALKEQLTKWKPKFLTTN